MSEKKIEIRRNISGEEKDNAQELFDLFKNSPIPNEEIQLNLGLYISRQSLSRIIFMHDLYKRIINTTGVVMEFGCRWGQNLALFQAFRGMYEPYNYNRKIIGFDSFEGFQSLHEKDGNAKILYEGAYTVTNNYVDHLEKVLSNHETESPISHIKKCEVIKGDATETLEKYLEEHPETIIAFAYFDFDIYAPTKRCLELIKNHVTKGTVLGFDELNWPYYPGETLALKEVLGLDTYKLQRSPLCPTPSFLVIE
ncbi:MAG: CalS11 [Ferruginibacter sp.]|nr:CalS11 [Ferruginibacter sp.]